MSPQLATSLAEYVTEGSLSPQLATSHADYMTEEDFSQYKRSE